VVIRARPFGEANGSNGSGPSYCLGGVGIRAGFGTGWKCVQQNSFLLYEDRRVVHPSAVHSRPRPYVLRGRPPDSLDRD